MFYNVKAINTFAKVMNIAVKIIIIIIIIIINTRIHSFGEEC